MTGLLLGVDIGTASSKGVLVDSGGAVLARSGREHPASHPRPRAALRLRAAGGAGTLAGLGISGIGPCLLPADDHGDPLRPAILYGVDTRAGAEIVELDAEFGAAEILARGGSPLTSQAVGPKVRWLARHEPD